MNRITITFDNNLQYTIEPMETYTPKEFMSTFENHITKVRKLMSFSEESEAIVDTSLGSGETTDVILLKNPLLLKISKMINENCINTKIKDSKTMCSFKYTKPFKGAKSIAWLAPSGHKLFVYLRKIDYSKIDSGNKVIYKGGFGGFPYIKIQNDDEIGYALNLVKYAYNSMEEGR